jgi:hypothetical protein
MVSPGFIEAGIKILLRANISSYSSNLQVHKKSSRIVILKVIGGHAHI